MTGGPFTVDNDITATGGATLASAAGSYVLTMGGITDSNSTFSGKITLLNNVTVSQVPTTGSNALNLTGGMYGVLGSIGLNGPAVAALDNTGFQTVTFTGGGSINVTGVIGDLDPNSDKSIACRDHRQLRGWRCVGDVDRRHGETHRRQ